MPALMEMGGAKDALSLSPSLRGIGGGNDKNTSQKDYLL